MEDRWLLFAPRAFRVQLKLTPLSFNRLFLRFPTPPFKRARCCFTLSLGTSADQLCSPKNRSAWQQPLADSSSPLFELLEISPSGFQAQPISASHTVLFKLEALHSNSWTFAKLACPRFLQQTTPISSSRPRPPFAPSYVVAATASASFGVSDPAKLDVPDLDRVRQQIARDAKNYNSLSATTLGLCDPKTQT